MSASVVRQGLGAPRCAQVAPRHQPRARPVRSLVRAGAAVQSPKISFPCSGASSVQGTSRKRNEDRFDIKIDENAAAGQPLLYAGVFDGHGGTATSDWLENNLFKYVQKCWQDGQSSEFALTEAFLKADEKLLQPKSGFFGAMGERGIGGSKCGSTAAVALVYAAPDGCLKLAAANVGDARVLLVRGSRALQLTEDHVPDSEQERERIEATNPNPRLPLVRYVGGTWRVGGILALSRAFGDAYMKGSLQFEGVRAGSDGYSSGFGVVAEPYTTLSDLQAGEEWLVLASDGLFENVVRGGGGGLSNEEVAAMLARAGPRADGDNLAKQLVRAAVDAGSTDDITVLVLRLGLLG